ncbi:MAG: carboxypeptidase regulatory-like domain-containing protein [Pyrinomonadaceae bacterium]|nr:carboxypeptidase regulatory-like domain-containing protein [Pyrinomonadaceae bacterium]
MMTTHIDKSTLAARSRRQENPILGHIGRMIFVIFAITIAFGATTLMAQTTVYNAVPATLAPSYPSQPFQAQQTTEFGDYVHLAGTDRVLGSVDVTMVTWAPKSDWPLYGTPTDWNHNFTINIYNVVAGSPLNTKGSLIATVTQSKSVPWRPAADPTCPGGTAWRAGDGSCYNGYAFNLSFDMSSLGSVLPNDIIIGISYNTQTYGTPPVGSPGPFNSLNVAAIGSPASVGSDANADRTFWNTSTAAWYTDGGAGGVGIFREDTGWLGYGTIPFKITASSVGPTIINAGYSDPFVNPSAWLIYNDESDTINNTLGSLVIGPGTPPLGNGSAQISVTGSQRRNLATYQFSGTVLSTINTLKFSTYNPSAGNGGSASRSGYLHFNVDFNGSDTWQRRIGFVPSQNGTVIQDQWQEWDAINGGAAMWFYSGATWPGTATPGTTLRSWSDILASYPGVRIRVTDSFFGIRVGEPYADGYTENIDAIKFGAGASLKYFNFDPLPPVTYVNTTWAGTAAGADPDGAGPATNYGYDAFDTIQGGIDGVAIGGTVNVAAGNYGGDVNLNKANVSLKGAGIDISYIIGSHISGGANTLLMNANGVLVEGFTITRSGNNVASWTSNLKNQGVNMSSPGYGMTLQNCKITGNRNGVYVGQSSNGNTIRRNIIDFNRTGIHLVDHSDDLIEENSITNNWTMGILYRSEGGPGPTGMTVRNNNITGNWYSEIEFREPAAGASLNMSGNYLGASITRTVLPSGEPGYTGQIPIAFGGGAVAPVSHPTIAGVESARVDYSPYLNSGLDTSLANGFQGDYTNISVTTDGAQVGSTSRIDEAISLTSAGGSIVIAAGTYSGNVTVNKAVNIKGSFTVSGSLSTTAVGASISPGNSPGIINSGNLTLGAGSTTNMELNGLSVGTQYDQLNVSGTVTINPTASLNPTLGFTPVAGNSFTIINNDGGDAVSGTFFGLPEGTVFYVLTTAFKISYIGGTGNDVVLTVVAPCNSVSIENEVELVSPSTVDVDISTDSTTGNGLKSTQFVVTFNPAVVTFNSISLGTVTAGRTMDINSSTPGVLNVSIYGANDFVGAGTLAVVTFNKVGLPGSSTPVSFGSFMFNEGTACISTTPGSVTITGGTITGSVLYSEHGGSPLARPVPNVTVNGAGTPPVSALTDGFGAYSLSGFGAGSYTRSASKVGQENGAVGGFDAAAISQHVVNLVPLTDARKLFVADVSGNGTVTSFDAALIARFAVALPGAGSSGTWVIKRTGVSPLTDLSTYGPSTVYADISGESYTAYLMGDVTGNWNLPTNQLGGRPAGFEGKKPLRISAPELIASANTEVVVPITIRDTTGRGINSYQFDLRYDPDVLEPSANTVDLSDSISEGYLATVNPIEPGLIKVVVFGPNPLAGSGRLMNLKFNVIGDVGSESALTWETFGINEGGIDFEVMDGRLVVSAASNDAAIAGRVLSAAGQPVGGATVTLVDTNGQTRTARTSSLGNFRFAELTIGQTYTVSVSAKRYTFAPQTVSVTGDAVDLDLIAEQ